MGSLRCSSAAAGAGDELGRERVGDRQAERRPCRRADLLAAGQIGVLERRAERHGGERRADPLDRRVEGVERRELDLRGDLGAEAAVADRLVRDDEAGRGLPPRGERGGGGGGGGGGG